jgi:hypothetical protein
VANDPSYAPAITFTQHPNAGYTNKGAVKDFGDSVTFTVVASGLEPLSYQWYFDGNPLVNDGRISGADTAELTITALDGPDAGFYRVKVTDANSNSADSLPVQLWSKLEHEIIINAWTLPAEAIVGTWDSSQFSGWFGARYAAQVAETATERTVTFEPQITKTGYYEVYTWFQPSFPGGNRTQQARYIAQHADGQDTVYINQQVANVAEFWHYVGTYQFEEGTSGRVIISNHAGPNGVVTNQNLVFADAVRWIPTDAPPVDVPAATVNITRGAGADVSLSIVGKPSTSYAVEVSDDLVNWTSLGTTSTDSEGVADFTDADATSTFSRRFYRVSEE